MAGFKGKEALISISAFSPENFQEIGSSTSTSLTINGTTVAIETMDHDGWTEKLDGAGIRSATVSAQGRIKDAGAAILIAAVNSGALYKFQFATGFGEFEGQFVCTSFNASGGTEGEQTYTADFESSGEVTFTPAS